MTDALTQHGDEGRFEPWPLAPGFIPFIAEVQYRPCGEGLEFRVAVQAHHCNESGGVHGGFLAAMADIWLGYNVAHRLGPDTRITTAGLGIDYLSVAPAGTWLSTHIDRVKLGRSLCHASGAIVGPRGVVAAMRGSFAVRERG